MDRHGLSCCRVSFWTFILQSIGSESKSAWKKSKKELTASCIYVRQSAKLRNGLKESTHCCYSGVEQLPNDVQDHLFKEAVASRGESIRSQLAVFLHDMHARTADPLGDPTEMKERDSLGG